jgi:hypothetical protein
MSAAAVIAAVGGAPVASAMSEAAAVVAAVVGLSVAAA